MSFSSDYEKNKNKNKTSNLLKVPQVVPQKTQQRVQAHGGQTQTTQRVNTQQRTTVRQNTSSGSSQRSTPIIQKTQSTQQTSFGLGTLDQMMNSGLASLGRTFAKNAQQQRQQSSTVQDNSLRARVGRANESKRKAAYAQARQTQADKTQLLKNSMDWHRTSDPNRRAQLRQQNDALRQKLGYYYDPASGSTYDKDGKEFTIGVRKAYNSTPTERLSQVDNTLYTSGVMGKKDKMTAYPTAYEAAQGVTVGDLAGQTGYNAHKALYDLFNRSDETWSKEDTQTRDRARQELSDEMSRILKQYGLVYQPRDNADDIMNRLKAAGADDDALAYAQENIDLRDAADRLGNSMEAVGKRWIASLPSLVDTSQQVSANVEESRQNEEYRQLEEQEQQLELTLQGMNSTAADGSVPADYQAVYDQLQDVKKRKNELTVNKSVDPNKWSQRMLREANEAQMNAEAGLAAAPRWLTEQGISLASNAPTMAASAIPVVGPAASAIIMGGQVAGQRSFELNERGIGARESLVRGMTSGAIEAASEKLPLGQMSKILHSGGTNAVKNILIQLGEEATEESASYFLNYVADKAAQDPDAKFSLQELLQSAASGAFGGLVYGTAGALGSRAATDTERNNAANAYNYDQNQINELVQIDSELQAALKLPEGPIRERAVQAAQNKMVDKISGLMTQQAAQNAELAAQNGAFDNLPDTPNGFAGKKIPTYDELIAKPDVRVVDIRETPVGSYKEQRKNFMNSEEAQQLYHQPVTNYDTGEMVFVTPKTLDHSFSNGGQLQISAAKQIKQIIEQSVLTNAEPITHGDTNATGIYTLFGAVQTENGIQPVKLKVKEYEINNQRIPQNIYDYFKQHGVPEQYASAYDNKVLALESIEKEDASSSVPPTLAADQAAQGEHPSASSFMETSGSIPPTLAADRAAQGEYPSVSSYITVADLMGLVNEDARRYLPGKYANTEFDGTSLDARTRAAQQLNSQTGKADAWQDGQVKPRLGTEIEERPESTYRTPEEESALQAELAKYFSEEQPAETGGVYDRATVEQARKEQIPLNELMQYGKTPEQAAMEANARAEGERVRQAMNRPEMREARMIAERLGAKFEVADLGAAGGRYENGTVTINPYADNPVRQVLVHELTHHLENSGVYNDLQAAALRAFSEEQGVSADVLRKNITNLYAQKGVMLDLDGANRELTAAFCENRLFRDENSIQRLAQTDLNLFQRIRQWFSDMVIRLRGTEEQKRILEVQRLYEKAARSVGTVQDKGAQYQIQQDAAGNDFVQVDEDILDGKTEKDHAAILSDIIRNKFGGVIEANGQTFGVNSKTNREWRWSNDARKLYKRDQTAYLNKIRVFNNADEIIQASTDYIGEAPKHARKDYFREFARGKVDYRVGANGYSADVVVGITGDGRAVLYDIVNIRDKKIKEASLLPVNETNVSMPIADASIENSISQNAANSNRSIVNIQSKKIKETLKPATTLEAQKPIEGSVSSDNSIAPDSANGNTSGTKFKGLALQREYRQAVESGNMERAREILAEKAARRGYSSYDTVADAQNHIIQNANPVEDDYHTWIRNAGDVHTFADVLNDSDWNGMDFDPDYTWDMAQKALQTGEITVYSSNPIGTLGGFVTPSRMEAEGYAGNGEVYSKTVNVNDIAWIDPTQGQYAPAQNGNIYKSGSPYAKMPDVTYDDNGKLIPLSQRYDDSRTDSRYTFGLSPEQIAKGTVPLNELMQYGKTPEQAAMEANARAEGERVRQAREAAEQQERLDRITNGKSRDIMQRVYEAQERAERVASRYTLERATTRATASDADSYIDHTQEDIAIDLVNSLESERRFLTNLCNGWHLSDAELVNAERMAAGRGPVTEMDSHRYELVETYARAMRQYNEDMQPYYAFQRGLDDARLRRATELIKDSDNWKDSRGNLGLQIRTPERVLRKVMGDTAETEAIYQAYFAPVLKHDAEAIRWENTQRERLKGIMEGLSHEDSVYMHMKNRAELAPKNDAMQKQLADYVKENKSKIHFKQAENAMQQLYEMTSEMHPQVSEAGVRNGYAPLEFRQKYIPSLTPTKEGQWYNRILRKVGVETMVDELPTEIAGRTEDRRPGRQYAEFYNQREGINTEFDAFKAMDNYISGASNAIFHTDDIQNLRVLEDAIRGKYSDEGSRAEIEAIRKDPDINIEDKEQKISQIWERNSGTLPSFPSWIAEYTNILAGKKSRTDRSSEQMFGRGLYRAMSDVEGKVAANMVGGNLSTAISNFIPLAQGSGEVRYSSMMRAMLDYGTDLAKKNPAFHEESDFLTNRRGSERVIKTKLQKASDAASWTMNAIDNLSSEVMVRARYLDNVEKRHMSTEAALQEADRWAAGLIGDRARGAKPVIMESKSPLIKAFTMFQLEVMNQYDHLFSDIPHYLRAQGKSKAQIAAGTAGALLQVFVMSHLFNDAREKLTGSRSAFDPIEMVNDFVGRLTGYALPNVFDLIGEMMGDGIDEDDFRAEKSETAWDNVKETAQDVASNVPFVSGPLGAVFGAGNSRLPIQSIIPNIDNIMTAQGEDARSMAIKKELSKPLYGFLLPFGGLQAKKTVEGAATMFAGGSYSYDKNGEKILQFPTYGQSPADWAQALLFGKSSSDEARAWRESGYETLNADETKVFDTLSKDADNQPESREAIYNAILALHDVQSDTDENGQLLDNEAEKKRRMLFENDKLTESQKTAIDRDLITTTTGGSTADYSDETSFEISTEVRKKMQGAAREAADAGLAVSTFVQYDNTLKELTEGTDESGEKLHTADEARGMVLDAIQQDSSLTDGEKQTLADYLLVSSMSEKARETWNDEVKGKVNASDYVRFKSDVAAYEAEFKGTGADNAANVANILNGYTNLTDEQKSVLMNTYNDTAKNDVFHVSEYEKSLADNSYYKSLNDSEKSKLRAYCNEYEQAINEGKELSGWKAKAYMAKEAGIEPGTYALFQTALSLINSDGGTAKTAEITEAVKLVPGLTDSQRAYLWQAAKGDDKTKNNPWGSATVTKYQKGENEAVNPVEGGTIPDGGGFGPRNSPTAGASSNHKAIDIAAAAGTPVKAAMSGTVTAVATGYNGGYGNTVEITHPNGLVTKYHHMLDGSVDGVSVGQEVSAGTQIGQVGSTGISTGPHLDFQVVKDGNYVDPRNYIPGYGEGTSATISAAQATVAASSGSSKSSKSSGSSSSKSSSGSSSSGLKTLDQLDKLGF